MASLPSPQLLARIGIMIPILLTACTTIKTHKPSGEEITMTQEEFSAYLEEAFRYHNQVMSDLIEYASNFKEHPGQDFKALSLAEKRMITECEPLNEVVTETLSGQSVALSLKLQLAEAVPNCRTATAAVDKLISD